MSHTVGIPFLQDTEELKEQNNTNRSVCTSDINAHHTYNFVNSQQKEFLQVDSTTPASAHSAA